MSEHITRRALIAGGAALAMVPMHTHSGPRACAERLIAKHRAACEEHGAELLCPVDALWTHEPIKGRWSRDYRGGVLLFTDGLGWTPEDMEGLLTMARHGSPGAVLSGPHDGQWVITIHSLTEAHQHCLDATDRAIQGGRLPPCGSVAWPA